MASTYAEPYYGLEFLISEAPGARSREAGTLASGNNLLAGAVLGKRTLGAATAAAIAGNTGNGAMGAVTVGAGAKAGVYRLLIVEPGTNVGTFIVEDPDGILVGTGVVASAFSKGGLSFTLADGSTDFVAGDGFTITVAAGTGKWEEYDPTNTNGSEYARGILTRDTDATSADAKITVIVRDAEYNADKLVWFSGASGGQKTTGKAQLALAGLIERDGI